MNNVILIGNLSRDAKITNLTNDRIAYSNALAVRANYKDEQGNYVTYFINIVAFGACAKILQNYAQKGSKIAIQGEWRVRTYQGADGANKRVDECLVNSVTLLDKKETANKVQKVEEEYEIDINSLPLPF